MSDCIKHKEQHMKTKHDKRSIKWLARNAKSKIVDWTRHLVMEVDAADPERAEKLMRLMQELSRSCNRLNLKWSEIVKAEGGAK